MRGKISLILVLILLLSSCSSNQTSIEEESNKVENINTDNDSDEKCLSDDSVETLTSEIAEITSELRNQEETLALSADTTYSEEELQNMKEDLAVLERVQADYESELSNSGNNEYIQQLRDRKKSLESQLGISYADVDFANFGQDAILAEVYDGIIAPLENKENLSREEKDVLDEAMLKLELLDTELNLFRSFNEDPEVEIRLIEIERLKNEISIAEGTGNQASVSYTHLTLPTIYSV